MNTYSTVIICLWLFPVFSFVLLPLLLSFVGLPLILAQKVLSPRETAVRERRRHLRFIPDKDFFAEVSLAGKTYAAQISDISQNGISLKGLPETLSNDISELSVVIKEYGMDCKLLLKTKWVELTESGKQLGASIDIPSPLWTKFLLRAESSFLPRHLPATWIV